MEHIILLKEQIYNIELWNNKICNKKIFKIESDPEQLKPVLNFKTLYNNFIDLKQNMEDYYSNLNNYEYILELLNNNLDQFLFEYNNFNPEHDPDILTFKLNVYLKNSFNLLFELIDLYNRPDINYNNLNELIELLKEVIINLDLEQFNFKTGLNNNYLYSKLTGSIYYPELFELIEHDLDMEEYNILRYFNIESYDQLNYIIDYDINIQYPILESESLLIDSINDYLCNTNIKYLNIDPEPYLIFNLHDLINLNEQIININNFKKHGLIIDPYKILDLISLFLDYEYIYMIDSYYESLYNYIYTNKCYTLNIYKSGSYKYPVTFNNNYNLLNYIEHDLNNISNFKIKIDHDIL